MFKLNNENMALCSKSVWLFKVIPEKLYVIALVTAPDRVTVIAKIYIDCKVYKMYSAWFTKVKLF